MPVLTLAALQPCLTLELSLAGQGRISLSSAWSFARRPGALPESQVILTGSSLANLRSRLAWPQKEALIAVPWRGLWEVGVGLGSSSLLSWDGPGEGYNPSTTLPPNIVLKYWVGPALKKGWHPTPYPHMPEAGTTARSSRQKSLSTWPVTWSKIHPTVLFLLGPENPMRMNKHHLRA